MASIRPNKAGTRFEVRDNKQHYSRTVDTHGEAIRIKAQLDAGGAPGRAPQRSAVVTFSDYVTDVYLPHSRLAVGTRRSMVSALNSLPGLKTRPLAWVASHRTEVEDEIAKSARVDHGALYMVVKRACDDAVARGVIDFHRLSGLNVRRSHVRRELIETTREQREFIAKGLGKYGLALWLFHGLGLRHGEAVSLHGSDFRAGFSIVRVSRNAERGMPGPLKCRNPGAYRDVPVPPWLAVMVREYVSEHGLGPLFPGGRGKPYPSHNAVGGKIGEIAAQCGVPGLTAHHFRHAYITAQLEVTNGDVAKVSKWSGDDVATVVAVYHHMTDAAMEAGRSIAQ